MTFMYTIIIIYEIIYTAIAHDATNIIVFVTVINIDDDNH